MSDTSQRAGSAVAPPGVGDREARERRRTAEHSTLRLLAIRLTLAGLLVELLSLALLHHPAGFVTFLIAGCALLGGGLVAYVSSVLQQIGTRGAP